MLNAWLEEQETVEVAGHVAGRGLPFASKSRARSESTSEARTQAGSEGQKALRGRDMVRRFGLFRGDIARPAIGKPLIVYALLRCTFSNHHYVKSFSRANRLAAAIRLTPHAGAERSHPHPLLQSRSRTP